MSYLWAYDWTAGPAILPPEKVSPSSFIAIYVGRYLPVQLPKGTYNNGRYGTVLRTGNYTKRAQVVNLYRAPVFIFR